MKAELELHPALTRLRRRLELCRAPLVRLWGWPRSGRHLLLRNLSRFHPRSWRPLDAATDLASQVSQLESSSPHLWFGGSLPAAALEGALDALAPGQRLYWINDRRCLGDLLPEEVVWPGEWLLRSGEVAALLQDPFASKDLDQLMLQTAGWWGPLRWLQRSRRASAEGGEADVGGWESQGFGRWLDTQVLAGMASLPLEILDACRLTGCSDVDLWRLAWIEAPQLLQALEELVHLDGWLGGAWPGLWSTGLGSTAPWSIERRHLEVGPLEIEARRALLHRRLAWAAQMSGRGDEAEHHLARSDRSQWRQRLQGGSASVGGGRATGPQLMTGPQPTAGPQPMARPQPLGGPRRTLQVTLFGLPQVVEHGVAATPRPIQWKIHRALMTLAYLLLAPQRRASREELVASVWDGADARSLDKNFHPTMSTLRRALAGEGATAGRKSAGRKSTGRGSGGQSSVASGSLLTLRHGVYALSDAVDWQVDVDEFQSLIADGEALRQNEDRALHPVAIQRWQQAWGLYRGALLSEVDEPWVVERRRRLHDDQLALLRRLAGLCSELGRHGEALDAYRSLLLEEPFEESVHIAIMEIYGLQGRRDLVRRQFVHLQELLRRELGVEPRAVSQERFQELMR